MIAISDWNNSSNMIKPFTKEFIIECAKIVFGENTFKFDDKKLSTNAENSNGGKIGTNICYFSFLEKELYNRYEEHYGITEMFFKKQFIRFLEYCFTPWEKTDRE